MSYVSQTEAANSTYFDTTFTNVYSANQTGGTLIVPTTGTRLAIKGIYIGSVATSGKVRVYIDSNSVLEVFGANQSGYVPLNVKGNRNSTLYITSTFGDNEYFVLVNYREE